MIRLFRTFKAWRSKDEVFAARHSKRRLQRRLFSTDGTRNSKAFKVDCSVKDARRLVFKRAVTIRQMAETAFPEGSDIRVDGLEYLPATMSELLGMSRSDARRLIDTGQVTIDGAVVEGPDYDQHLVKGKLLVAGGRRRRVRL